MRRATLAVAILALRVMVAAPALWAEAGETKALFVVQKQGKYGFIDRTGKMVIPAKFNRAWSFAGGLAEVIQGETEGYIDQPGEWVWPPGQLQEPPTPPPGYVQPSPDKPVAEKGKPDL